MKNPLKLLRDNIFAAGGATLVFGGMVLAGWPIWVDMIIMCGLFLLWIDVLTRSEARAEQKAQDLMEERAYAERLRKMLEN